MRDVKTHLPNVFAAPSSLGYGKVTESTGSHHQAPVFPSEPGSSMDWTTILDELPYGFVVLDPSQNLRHENASCKRMLGYSIAEKGGIEGWLSALCPDPNHRQKVISSWREQIWRNQLTRTFTLRAANQKPKEIEFRSSLLRDGGITLTFEDVTETRRTEETLRHGKLRFRALFTHTRTGTVLVDRTGRIIDANTAFISLSGISLRDLRLSTLSSLLHPGEAAALAEAEEALHQTAEQANTPPTITRQVWLRTPNGEKRVHLTYSPIGESSGPSSMGIYFFDSIDATVPSELLKARLRTVSQKAQALLSAVPDLIFLVEANGTIIDFALPPKAWKEVMPDDSWRQQPLSETWPVLGRLLEQCRPRLAEGSRAIHAEIRGQAGENFEFSVTLSAGGDGHVIIVVRNQSELRTLRERLLWQEAAFLHAPTPILRLDPQGAITDTNAAANKHLGKSKEALIGNRWTSLVAAGLPSGTVAEFYDFEGRESFHGSLIFLNTHSESENAAPPAAPVLPPLPSPSPSKGRRQHSLRNQLQLVTSLFSLEPQGSAARESFLKWQVRLRCMALACPIDDTPTLWVFPLLRNMADEICSLVGRGPGRREVIITGDEDLTIDVQTATAFSLLIGELMRLVLGTQQTGPGPELYLNLQPSPNGGFQLSVRPGNYRQFIFSDREAEIETLVLLTEQIQGRLEASDEENPSKEWTLIVPQPSR